MLKKTMIVLFVFASIYFTYNIIASWGNIEEHKIKELKYLYDNQQYMEKRIKEIESRRDALEKTMVEYMKDLDKRISKVKEAPISNDQPE